MYKDASNTVRGGGDICGWQITRLYSIHTCIENTWKQWGESRTYVDDNVIVIHATTSACTLLRRTAARQRQNLGPREVTLHEHKRYNWPHVSARSVDPRPISMSTMLGPVHGTVRFDLGEAFQWDRDLYQFIHTNKSSGSICSKCGERKY